MRKPFLDNLRYSIVLLVILYHVFYLFNSVGVITNVAIPGIPELDAVLYYVNQDIPVLAYLKNGDTVLITGFNEFNVVIMDPSDGSLTKKGKNDASQWFEENGNCFVTYVYDVQ